MVIVRLRKEGERELFYFFCFLTLTVQMSAWGFWLQFIEGRKKSMIRKIEYVYWKRINDSEIMSILQSWTVSIKTDISYLLNIGY